MGIFEGMWNRAYAINQANILKAIQSPRVETLCDLGCDDGRWTSKLAVIANARKLYGIDIIPEQADKARERGIEVAICDLNDRFPYEDESFDIVHANQVIEHIAYVDHFVAEAHRIMKKNGILVISTENASSWHNIFASVMGWQQFSLTNVSAKVSGIGNPLAIHRKEKLAWSSWTHKVIFNYLGLIEFFQCYDFRVEQVWGAGYYPLPAVIGNVDKRHAHFLTLKLRKV